MVRWLYGFIVVDNNKTINITTMFWMLIAISTHFFWALSGVGDKYVLEHKMKNGYVYMIWIALLGGLVALLIPFTDFYIPDAKTLVLLAFGGLFFFLGALPYAKAVQIEEITRISVWWSLQPVFGVFVGWSFGDKFTLTELMAIGILVVAAFVASLHANKKVVFLSPAVLFMMLATFLFSMYAAILHVATQDIPFFHAFIWTTLAKVVFAGCFFLSSKFRRILE